MTFTLRRLIEAESHRQIALWGARIHSPAEWGLIATEEFGEAMKELCQLHFARDPRTRSEARAKFVDEAVQAVTLLLKMIRMAEEEARS